MTLQGEEGAHARFTNAGIIYSNDVLRTLNNIDLSGSYSSHVAVIRDNKSVMIDNSVMDAAAGGNGPMMRRNGYVLIMDCTINNASRTALLANSGIVSIITSLAPTMESEFRQEIHSTRKTVLPLQAISQLLQLQNFLSSRAVYCSMMGYYTEVLDECRLLF